jgi:hypothetical protein
MLGSCRISRRKMLSKILDVIIPTRRRFIKKFGSTKYISSELMKRILAAENNRKPEVIRIIYFACPDWGFTDQALPKLNEFLRKLVDADVTVTNSSLTIRCFGENSKHKYEVFLSDLKLLIEGTEFEGFRISTAEGMQSSYIDIGRITNQAMRALDINSIESNPERHAGAKPTARHS